MLKMVNFGDRISNGGYHVHSRFGRVVNFFNGNSMVSLVKPEIGAGPVNIVVDGIDNVDESSTLLVDDDGFVVCETNIDLSIKSPLCEEIVAGDVSRMSACDHAQAGRFSGFKSAAPVADQKAAIYNRVNLAKDPNKMYVSSFKMSPFPGGILEVFEKMLLECAPKKSLMFLFDKEREKEFSTVFEKELMRRMREGAAEMREGNFAEGARKLKGIGFGLTPSGDDFLCGFLIGLNAAEKITGKDYSREKQDIYENACGGNLISNAFFACAKEGRLFERFKNLLNALSHSDENAVKTCSTKLLQVGETSGADTAAGFLFSMKFQLNTRNTRNQELS